MHTRRSLSTSLVLGLAVVSLTACQAGPPADGYDIVILNGRVMDPETEFDAVRNVGIRDGLIVTITESDISGADSIDASGHVVAPGFVDTHVHSSNQFNIKMNMMDGVTSALDYELGALNIAEWYERERGLWPINYGQCVGHEYVRMVVHDGLEPEGPLDATDVFDLRARALEDGTEGWSVTVSNRSQINEISRILDENLRQGALCVGTTPGYASSGISTYELFEVQRAAARYGRPIGSHTRFHTSNRPPTEAALGFDEVFANAVVLDAPLLYSHNNDYGWWEIEEKLALARERGFNMWSEYYPYAAGSTAIGAEAIRPESLEGALGLSYPEVMFDPSQDKYLSKEEYLQIASEDPGRTVIVFNPAREEWMESWLTIPHMVVASDAMWSTDPEQDWDTDPAEFSGHPRTSGSRTIVLRMAREANVPLMFTLSQLSYWPALHLGDTGLEFMQSRGRLQEGMAADLVVFDPETVREGSSYSGGESGLPPIGLPHVLVNGQFVKRDNIATDVLAGLPIRYPVEEEGRFVPVTVEQIN